MCNKNCFISNNLERIRELYLASCAPIITRVHLTYASILWENSAGLLFTWPKNWNTFDITLFSDSHSFIDKQNGKRKKIRFFKSFIYFIYHFLTFFSRIFPTFENSNPLEINFIHVFFYQLSYSIESCIWKKFNYKLKIEIYLFIPLLN